MNPDPDRLRRLTEAEDGLYHDLGFPVGQAPKPLRDRVAAWLNKNVPDIDPHDDESYLVDVALRMIEELGLVDVQGIPEGPPPTPREDLPAESDRARDGYWCYNSTTAENWPAEHRFFRSKEDAIRAGREWAEEYCYDKFEIGQVRVFSPAKAAEMLDAGQLCEDLDQRLDEDWGHGNADVELIGCPDPAAQQNFQDIIALWLEHHRLCNTDWFAVERLEPFATREVSEKTS